MIPVEVSGAAETAVGNFRLSPASRRIQHNIRLSLCLENSSVEDNVSCCGVNTFPAKPVEMDFVMSIF